MANLESNISGMVLYFYEMPPIVISAPIGTPVRFVLETDDKGVLLDEIYWPDFSGKVEIDIKDIVANELYLEVPPLNELVEQASIFKVFHYDIGEGEDFGSFTVNGYSKHAATRVSDINELRIPKDYVLPVTMTRFYPRLVFSLHDAVYRTDMTLVESEEPPSGVGAGTVLIDLGTVPLPHKNTVKMEYVVVGWDKGIEQILSAPVFEICEGHFEQYLFANRYGGFDNIAMDGVLEFIPEMSFETGLYNGTNEQTQSDAEYIYSQNSGHLSRKTIEVMSELLCSSQIYHLDKDRNFRRIVILDSNLASRSDAYLHSFTFKFKYADDSRPLSLKGKTSDTYGLRGGESLNTAIYALTDSPMIIQHNRNNFPFVTVTDKNNQLVTVAVEYIDNNTVELTWNGDLSGYAYIR